MIENSRKNQAAVDNSNNHDGHKNQENISVKFTNLFDRSKQVAFLSQSPAENSALIHDDEEYLSMILNLKLSLQCDGWVGTLRSNWCRVVDEMRSTVGGKAEGLYADLSRETCDTGLCLWSANNYKAHDWRR